MSKSDVQIEDYMGTGKSITFRPVVTGGGTFVVCAVAGYPLAGNADHLGTFPVVRRQLCGRFVIRVGGKKLELHAGRLHAEPWPGSYYQSGQVLAH